MRRVTSYCASKPLTISTQAAIQCRVCSRKLKIDKEAQERVRDFSKINPAALDAATSASFALSFLPDKGLLQQPKK